MQIQTDSSKLFIKIGQKKILTLTQFSVWDFGSFEEKSEVIITWFIQHKSQFLLGAADYVVLGFFGEDIEERAVAGDSDY